MSNYFVPTDGISGTIEVSYFVGVTSMAPSPNDQFYGSSAMLYNFMLVFPDGSLDMLPGSEAFISWGADGSPSFQDPAPASFLYPAGTEGIAWNIITNCPYFCAGAASINVVVIPDTPLPSAVPLPAALPLFVTGLLLFAVTRKLRDRSRQPRHQ